MVNGKMNKLLNKENSLLLIIDVQEKLVGMLNKSVVVSKVASLAKAASIMNIPTVVTQQYTKGLGETAELVKANLHAQTEYFEKTSFSALKEEGFKELLEKHNRKQIVICGIETHICVHQTAADLIKAGYDVYVAKDACASRNKYEFKQGIERMQENGAKISCLEIILFEWLKSSKDPAFKDIQALIK